MSRRRAIVNIRLPTGGSTALRGNGAFQKTELISRACAMGNPKSEITVKQLSSARYAQLNASGDEVDLVTYVWAEKLFLAKYSTANTIVRIDGAMETVTRNTVMEHMAHATSLPQMMSNVIEWMSVWDFSASFTTSMTRCILLGPKKRKAGISTQEADITLHIFRQFIAHGMSIECHAAGPAVSDIDVMAPMLAREVREVILPDTTIVRPHALRKAEIDPETKVMRCTWEVRVPKRCIAMDVVPDCATFKLSKNVEVVLKFAPQSWIPFI